jgi:hypothetical protein
MDDGRYLEAAEECEQEDPEDWIRQDAQRHLPWTHYALRRSRGKAENGKRVKRGRLGVLSANASRTIARGHDQRQSCRYHRFAWHTKRMSRRW